MHLGRRGDVDVCLVFVHGAEVWWRAAVYVRRGVSCWGRIGMALSVIVDDHTSLQVYRLGVPDYCATHTLHKLVVGWSRGKICYIKGYWCFETG
jgi:hypothetical protein